MSSYYNEKPPPPPIRYNSGANMPHASDLELRPLPREPEHSSSSLSFGFGSSNGNKKTKKSKSFGSKSTLRIHLQGVNAEDGSEKDKERYNDKPVISLPSDFQHTVHVGYDPHTGEFTVSCLRVHMHQPCCRLGYATSLGSAAAAVADQ